MTIHIYQVDAFTGQPFKGNPAGVCLLDEPRPAEWMQDLAREMNLSETAFLVKEEDGYRLRWFTPKVEVALCGHATLGSAHILFQTGRLQPWETARFHTLSGTLMATRSLDGWITLDFPSRPVKPATAPDRLFDALGISASVFVGKNVDDYLVELDSETSVRSLHPDFPQLYKIPARGVIVTSRSESKDFDFISRFFAPAVGVNEDPVTGSAHTCLTPFWAEKLHKKEMRAYQASERGGVLKVGLQDQRVLIGGQAVTIFTGDLCV